jgi:hypothetical protein
MQINDKETDVARRRPKPLWIATLCAVIVLILVIAIALLRERTVRNRGVERAPHPPVVTYPGSNK